VVHGALLAVRRRPALLHGFDQAGGAVADDQQRGDSSTTAKRTFNRGVEGLLRSIDMTPLDPTDDGEETSSA
jgi:hypothetical protein